MLRKSACYYPVGAKLYKNPVVNVLQKIRLYASKITLRHLPNYQIICWLVSCQLVDNSVPANVPSTKNVCIVKMLGAYIRIGAPLRSITPIIMHIALSICWSKSVILSCYGNVNFRDHYIRIRLWLEFESLSSWIASAWMFEWWVSDKDAASSAAEGTGTSWGRAFIVVAGNLSGWDLNFTRSEDDIRWNQELVATGDWVVLVERWNVDV